MKKTISFILALALLAAPLFGCEEKTEGETATEHRTQENTAETLSSDENNSETSTETETDYEMFDKIKAFIAEKNINVYDIAIMDDSHSVTEYRCQPCNTCNDSYSVAKVFTLTAIGMLVDEGKLSVDAPVYPMFSELFPADYDKKWESVTVQDVIAHKIGLAGDCLDIDLQTVSEDEYLDELFSQKLVYEPGTQWVYSDGAYYLLSRIVTKISGERLDDFLRTRLLSYMGVQEAAWSQCSQGYPMGATGLYISAADIVKLGWCYVNGGVYRRHQYFSADWADYVVSNEYEFIKQTDGVYCKYGFNGQALMICENSKTVVAWHGFITDGGANMLGDYIAKLDKEYAK